MILSTNLFYWWLEHIFIYPLSLLISNKRQHLLCIITADGLYIYINHFKVCACNTTTVIKFKLYSLPKPSLHEFKCVYIVTNQAMRISLHVTLTESLRSQKLIVYLTGGWRTLTIVCNHIKISFASIGIDKKVTKWYLFVCEQTGICTHLHPVLVCNINNCVKLQEDRVYMLHKNVWYNKLNHGAVISPVTKYCWQKYITGLVGITSSQSVNEGLYSRLLYEYFYSDYYYI